MQADHVDCKLGLLEGQAFYDQDCPQLTGHMWLMLTNVKQPTQGFSKQTHDKCLGPLGTLSQ